MAWFGQAGAALQDSSPGGLGFIPIGLAFGVFLTHAGLPWWCASLFASVIYAGSFEFLLVGLVTALVPLAAIALTAFLVNVRHVFYALSFPLHRVHGRGAKAYSTFTLSDEAYALSTSARAHGWPTRRILWLQGFLHLYWVAGATAGALLGGLIPDRVTGLSFAMTALFAVLAIEAISAGRDDLPTPVLAAGSVLAARLLVPGELLLTAFALFSAGLLARYLVTSQRACHA